ncbi:MAG: aminotransferase class III-fold pyridoxal phosphate-dependent enzyme, partial [Myxococcota bacterium]
YDVKGVAPDRAEIIACTNNFHGRTVTIISFSTEDDYRAGFGPLTPGFHVVVTDNASPDDLPPALRDRFDAVIQIEEPHPEALMRLSEPLRSIARRGFALDDARRVSIRGWLVLDRLRDELGLELACVIVFGLERGAQIHDAIVLGWGG